MFGQKNPQVTALSRPSEAGLGSWSPWNDMADLRHRMDDLFSRAFGYTPLSRMIPGEGGAIEPAVDIYGTDETLLLFAELPGFGPDAISVEATPDTISIHGECKPLYPNEHGVVYRQGWVCREQRLHATYSLPEQIDPNRITATFTNGILRLGMQKAEQARKKSVHVDVRAAA
jgi:HSP20 family protein